MSTANCLILIVLCTGTIMRGRATEVCDALKGEAESSRSRASRGEIRWVDPSPSKGVDNESCGAETFPCATLDIALSPTSSSSQPYNVTIYIASGLLLEKPLVLQDASRISIIGSGGPDRTEFQCANRLVPSALQIFNSSDIYIANITFTRCGSEESSVLITGSADVVFENCIFHDNDASSVIAYETGLVVFISCSFYNNHYYGSATPIAYIFDNTTAAAVVSLFAQRQSVVALVLDSKFFNNSRGDSELAQGGGINARALGNNNQLCIEGTEFDRNSAYFDGGAIAIVVGNGTSNTAVVINNSIFRNNSCMGELCSGGAVDIDIKDSTLYNRVEITGSSFITNRASTGGAVSISTTDNIAGYQNDTVVLCNCTFIGNRAYYDGTALGIYSLVRVDEISLSVQVQDCIFARNSPTIGQDSGAVNIYHTLIIFKGNTMIYGNTGGGMTLLDSQMAIQGRVELFENSAVYGGGLVMSGRSLIVMYSDSYLSFVNNTALQEGGGLYVEYTSNAYFLTILNKNCFLQYYSNVSDIAPNLWNATIEFINNTAGRGGAAIFSTDFSQCTWFGDIKYDGNTYIFLNQPNYTNSPFKMSGNKLLTGYAQGAVSEVSLASAPSVLILMDSVKQDVSFGEKVNIQLQSRDQLNNSRESVYSVIFPPAAQKLGSLSSTGGVITYDVPSANSLFGVVDNAANVSILITLINNETSALTVNLFVKGCHPGYELDDVTHQCVCKSNLMGIIARCDDTNRYFYSLGYWVGVTTNNTVYFGKTIPGFLNCASQGLLQGCLFKYDAADAQCASGRRGTLCGQCTDGYGPTFDLQFCDNTCDGSGIVLYIVVCCFVVIFSVFVLHWDIRFPDELKGFIFYAQVIGVIYRNSSYLHFQIGQNRVFSFMVNMLGYALPFPVCLWQDSSVLLVSGLGIIPSILATIVAFTYGYCAHQGRILQHSKSYGFHGFYFLYLFAYKYYLDVSFVFISCQKLEATGSTVFTYNGNIECLKPPFVGLFVLGLVGALIFGVLLPLYFLYLLYRQTGHLQVYNAVTNGLKENRRYIWYGVWSIWRRLLFVATSLLVAITSQSVILFIHCLIALLCLLVTCIVQPYKKTYINVIEALTLLCLFGATIALLDDEDIYVNGISTIGIIFTCAPFCFAGLYLIFLLLTYAWKTLNKQWDLNTPVEIYYDSMKSKYLRLRYRKAAMVANSEPVEDVKKNGNIDIDRESTSVTDISVKNTDKFVELREPLLM